MAIIINDNLAVNVGKPIDSKYLNITTPWSSIAAVNAGIPIAYRYSGLTTNINGVEYWYKNGITNSSLVLKSLGGNISGATNGLNITNGIIALGGALTGNTVFNGTGSKYNLQYAGDYSSNYTARSIPDVAYVNSIAVGLTVKKAVVVATTGTNLTFLSGLQTIDGYTLQNGDRILVKDQISGETNGVYIATGSTWFRAPDFDGSPTGETRQGNYLFVITGNTNSGDAWILTTPDPIIIGVTPLTFVFFNHIGEVVGGTGITVTSMGGTRVVSVSGTSLAGNSILWSGNTFNVNINSGTLNNVLNSKLNTTVFNIYTGDTAIILNTTITGATNGLTRIGRKVVLGGTLTGNTIFDGTGSNYNLQYAGDYSSNFTNRSIPDVAYLTGKTSCFKTVTSCNNEIIFDNSGSLSGNTNLQYCHSKDALQINTGSCACCCGSVAMAVSLACGTGSVAMVNSCTFAPSSLAMVNGTAYGNNSVAMVFGTTCAINSFAVLGFACGCNSIAIGSTNKVSSINGAVIGGCNNCLDVGNDRSILLGGDSITIPVSTFIDTAIVPNLAIWCTPVGSGNILAWNPTTKLVCKTNICALNAITGATNGITKNSNIVVLGGTLTGNTVFNGTGSKYNLQYAGNYSSNFINRSIPDVAYVTGLTSQAILTACNGLTKVGTAVKLGGALTAPTTICTGTILCQHSLTIMDDTGGFSNANFNYAGMCFNSCYSAQCHYFAMNIPFANCTFQLSSFATGGGIIMNIDFGCGIMVCDTHSTINKTLINYGQDYTASMTRPNQVPSLKYVTGLTSAISSNIITGVTNGLTKIGKNIVLGGTLTGNTIFNGTGSKYNLRYAGDYSSNYTARSIPDTAYITGYTQNYSNVVGVCMLSSFVYTATTSSSYIGASGGTSIYLPAISKLGQRISIADISGCALSCSIIVNGNGKCIGNNTCAIINTNYGSITFINNGSFWSAVSFIN